MTDAFPQISNTFMHFTCYWCIFQIVTHQEFTEKKMYFKNTPRPLHFWLVKIMDLISLDKQKTKRGNALVTGNTSFIKLHFSKTLTSTVEIPTFNKGKVALHLICGFEVLTLNKLQEI